MSEQRATMDFLCGLCNEYTRAPAAPAALGDNRFALTCTHCGEIWHIMYEVTSLEPFTVGHWEIKRRLGTMRGNQFYAKEDMQ